MLSAARLWLPFGLLFVAANGVYGTNKHGPVVTLTTTTSTTTCPPSVVVSVATSTYKPTISTTTTTTTTKPTTTTVPTTITESTTKTTTVPTTTVECVTSTVLSTITLVTTVYTTITLTTVTPTTATEFTTTTIPTTTTLTLTHTTFPISTSFTTLTVFDPCPSSCSISAGTVNVVYWPTDKPHSYPATYVDTSRGYTFHSPSVYFLINTMYGTASHSGPKTGPDAHSVIWAFDLDEVSTLVLPEQTLTRQLSLSDLGTDCPQSMPQSVILTKQPNSRCDPVLAAPIRIREWAWPCNACGPFGMFDPPYAVPTLAGGLLGTTTTAVAPTVTSAVPVISTTASAAPVSPAPTTPTETTSERPVVTTASSLSSSLPSTSAPAQTAAAGRVVAGPVGVLVGLVAWAVLF